MSGVQIAAAKAPWVMFERRAEEDRSASIEAGRYVARDVDYVLITPHGSRDQIERVVSEWFDYLKQQVAEQRFEADWLAAYRRAYDAWKEGKEIPVEGTPVINWPVASPAQVRMLQDLRILTVEVLAEANSELIARLGMGGLSLVEKAKAFVSQANGPGKLAEQIADLKTRTEAAERINADLIEKNKVLARQLEAMAAGKGNPPAHLDVTQAPHTGGEASGISSNDLLGGDSGGGFKSL